MIRKEIKEMLRLAGPIMGAQVAWISMIFVDTVVVGRIGESELASMTMAFTYNHFFFVFAMGIVSALSPIVSQAFGEKNYEKIGPMVRQGLWVTAFLAGIILVAFQWATPLLLLIKQQPELIPTAQSYLRSVSWGIPALLAFFTMRQYCEGVSDSKVSLYIFVIGALLNVPLDYALVLGKFGFPKMGVDGAAFATAILSWIMFLGILFYTRRESYKKFRFWEGPVKIDMVRIREFLRVGLPIGGSMTSEMAYFASITFMMGSIGVRELAAHQIALNPCATIFMVPLGLSFASGIRVGQAYGRRDADGVRRAGWVSFGLAFGFMAFWATLFYLFPQYVAVIYTSDPALTEAATVLIQFGALFMIVDGLQVAGIGSLRGLKDTKIPFYLTLVAFWVIGFPTAYYFGFTLGYGPVGLWSAMSIALAAASICHWIRFRMLTRADRFTLSAMAPASE